MLVKSEFFTTHLIEIFKNHKLIKIFQTEKYENSRSETQLDELKEKIKKMAIVFVRATPIMETLNWNYDSFTNFLLLEYLFTIMNWKLIISFLF